MGYSEAMSKLQEGRAARIGALIGDQRPKWFSELWGSIGGMLASFTSSAENAKIGAVYATGTANERVEANVKLDYVCGLRREVRKQYVSGEGDVFTDVTPFRHGAVSAVGARAFDAVLDQVMSRKGGK